MYQAYWGLRSRPFDGAPDPRFLFQARGHAEAFAKLLYVVENRLGGALLAGEPGVGKSLVARAMAAGLKPDRFQVGVAYAPEMSGKDLLLSVLVALGETAVPRRADELNAQAVSDALERRLAGAEQAGRHPVVILDDADLMAGADALRMCRYLMSRTNGERFRMTLLLVGNLDLVRRISSETDRALESHLAVKARLKALSREEAQAYILHRLQVAGSKRGLFTEQAAARICEASGGVPAQINRLCDLSLLAGYGLEMDLVVPDIVELVLEQIQD